MSNLLEHAKREFEAIGYKPIDEEEDGPNKWIQENILELLKVFSEQGHSGFSASYCVGMFKKLAMFEPLAPLQGTDDEWNDIGGEMGGKSCFQNNRCSHVFKDGDGKAYDINGKVFCTPDKGSYTSGDSRVFIKFPYIPKVEYVNVKE